MPDDNYARVQRERERADLQKRLRTELQRDRNARAKTTEKLLRESGAQQSASDDAVYEAAQGAQHLEALRYLDEGLQRANSGDFDGGIRALTFAKTLAPSQEMDDLLEMLKEWQRTGSRSAAQAHMERLQTQRAERAKINKAEAERADTRAVSTGAYFVGAVISLIAVAAMFHNQWVDLAVLVLLIVGVFKLPVRVVIEVALCLGWTVVVWFAFRNVIASIAIFVFVTFPLSFVPLLSLVMEM